MQTEKKPDCLETEREIRYSGGSRSEVHPNSQVTGAETALCSVTSGENEGERWGASFPKPFKGLFGKVLWKNHKD